MDAIDELRNQLPKLREKLPLREKAVIPRKETARQFSLQCSLLDLTDDQKVTLAATTLRLYDRYHKGVLYKHRKRVLSKRYIRLQLSL